MARKPKGSILYVYMNGRRVGRLVRPTNAPMEFAYDQEWLSWEGGRPISLSIPMVTKPSTEVEVFNFFDNLLPDNKSIRERIQARFGTDTTQPFDLLEKLGGDCVGALQLTDSDTLPSVKKVTAIPVNDAEIARRLKSYKTAPLGMQEGDDFRISIAGAQEKTAFLWYEDQWQVPTGATPTTHIFKLPIGQAAGQELDLTTSCENEWLCMQIVAAFGLPTASVELAKFKSETVLIVERFDRRWSKIHKWVIRLPQEDMCQALGVPPGKKYESDGGPGIAAIMKILRYSLNADEDRHNFMKAMVVFWLLAAIDGHGKNFSVFIKPEGAYELTPLYDIMSAYPLVKSGQMQKRKLKMGMAALGKNKQYVWNNILPRHWISTAQKVGFDEEEMLEIMIECFDSVERIITEVSKKLPRGFPKVVSESIFDGMKQLRDRHQLAVSGLIKG